MRISDWSSDVCSSDLARGLSQSDPAYAVGGPLRIACRHPGGHVRRVPGRASGRTRPSRSHRALDGTVSCARRANGGGDCRRGRFRRRDRIGRSEEHTSELQSLMRISYAVFCLKKKKTTHKQTRKRKTYTL